MAKVRKWWLEALGEVEKIVQPEDKLILWSAEDQEQRRRERAVEYLISAGGPLSLGDCPGMMPGAVAFARTRAAST